MSACGECGSRYADADTGACPACEHFAKADMLYHHLLVLREMRDNTRGDARQAIDSAIKLVRSEARFHDKDVARKLFGGDKH